MVSMTTSAAPIDSPVSLFQFSSDSEDYDSPSRGESVVLLLGTAFLAIPAGLIGLAVVPIILGARAVRRLANAPR